MSHLTVFRARAIHTMNPSWPHGSAVAVREGRIVEVGTLKTLQPWLERFPHTIDDQFADRVLLPGFVDPHLHPSMAAMLLPMHFVTALEWRLPWETVVPVTSAEGFLERLAALHQSLDDPNEPLFVWGYHPLWHGELRRPQLDSLVADRPVVIWHRSFHEIILNSKALEWLGIDQQDIGAKAQIDWEGGRFFENGLGYAIAKLNPHLFAADRHRSGLERLKLVAHAGGATTLGDMAVGIFDFEREWQGSLEALDNDTTPFRVAMVPAVMRVVAATGSSDAAAEFIASLPERNTHRLRFGKRVKLFTDGAFFSLLAQVQEPGYLDGHQGEWLTAPEQYLEMARRYWNEGYAIHVHCTGDLGLELALDTLDRLQWERPRFDHEYTIEHFGFATPEQVSRIATLGARVSANVHYLHELSTVYARHGVGTERANQMARLASCVNAGIRVALHSDFPMAPARPLHNAWVAATRMNHEEVVVAPRERLSIEQALRAITIDAAYMLGLQNEVGSVRAGKRADFAVLDEDPFAVGAEGLRELKVEATVFEGRVFPVPK
jgi:predicted amidohydrolase YtcJ